RKASRWARNMAADGVRTGKSRAGAVAARRKRSNIAPLTPSLSRRERGNTIHGLRLLMPRLTRSPPSFSALGDEGPGSRSSGDRGRGANHGVDAVAVRLQKPADRGSRGGLLEDVRSGLVHLGQVRLPDGFLDGHPAEDDVAHPLELPLQRGELLADLLF